MEARLRQRREKQVRSCKAPDNLARGAGSNASYEKCRRRAVDSSRAAAGKFMQSAIGQASAWQAIIDVGYVEG